MSTRHILKEQVALREGLQDIFTNEQITRNRVSKIEDVLRRGLLGRLRWLLFGS